MGKEVCMLSGGWEDPGTIFDYCGGTSAVCQVFNHSCSVDSGGEAVGPCLEKIATFKQSVLPDLDNGQCKTTLLREGNTGFSFYTVCSGEPTDAYLKKLGIKK